MFNKLNHNFKRLSVQKYVTHLHAELLKKSVLYDT